MRTAHLKTLRLLAMAAVLTTTAPAMAVLQDKGPAHPVLVWPQWYRDLGGTALGLCLSTAQSPNPASGLAPMCFPYAAVPTSFAGNVGDELFYSNLTASVNGANGFTLRYVAALEAAYVPGPHPAHGEEVVFGRIRFLMNVQVPGTYTVTHPYGVQVFPDVEANGPRSVFYTIDLPPGVPLDFAGALDGNIGPFIHWDVLNPGESLTVGGERFLGDPNYEHTYTGSPFGTNYVRVDGPPGSNLDGAGNDFIVQPLGTVLGQIWTAPIPTPFNVEKAAYRRDASVNAIDVWATSAPGQKLILTGTSLPSLQLHEYPAGHYYGHVEEPSAATPPAAVTVTNLSSNPVISRTVILADQLDAIASFTALPDGTGTLSVSATSTDLSSPQLAVLGPYGGLMTSTGPGASAYAATVPAGAEPPIRVSVESNAGGLFTADVFVLPGMPMNGPGLPVAVDDAPVVAGATSTAIDVLANDTYTLPASILILTQPVTGTATAPASGGPVTYTPAPGASGADGFTYVIQDVAGLSNVVAVSFTVPFVAAAPTATPNNFATQTGTTRNLNVLGNDTAAAGTAIDPLSVQVTGAGASFNALNGGLVTYAAGGATGVFTFGYTVANTAGTRSAPATVTMVAFGGPESVSVGKALYTISKKSWTIVGSTNWFNAALTQLTATCWLGAASAPTASTFIGSGPIDTSGKFQLVPAGVTPTPTNGQTVTCQSSSGGIGRTGTVAK